MEEKVKKTPEEVKKIRLANLKQNKGLVQNKNIIPEEIKEFVYSHICTLLSPVEFFIYINEISGWIKDHKEWTLKEDIDDMNGIAMEKVMQFRLLSDKKNKKSLDIEREFTSSKNREMVHRRNLGANRSSRIEEKKSVTNNNIVLLAGRIDDGRMKKITTINSIQNQEDDSMFPKRTVQEVIDIRAEEISDIKEER